MVTEPIMTLALAKVSSMSAVIESTGSNSHRNLVSSVGVAKRNAQKPWE